MLAIVDDGTWLQMRRDVRVFSEGEHFVVLSEEFGLEIAGEVQSVGALLQRLTHGETLGALTQSFGPEIVSAVVAQLLRHQLVVAEAEVQSEGDRHSQMFGWLSSLTIHPATAQKRLAEACVCVIGVGGLGGQVLEHLVGAGIGSLIFVDGDRVTPSNLNRQYQFSQQHLGMSKVTTMEDVLRERAPEARLVAIDRYIHSPDDFACLDTHEFDLLINCADVPPTLDRLAAGYASRRDTAFVSAGLGVNRGFWGPLFATDPLRHLIAFQGGLKGHLGAELANWNCSTLCRSSNGPYNSVVASMLAADAIMFLSGAGKPQCADRRCYINFRNLGFISTQEMANTV